MNEKIRELDSDQPVELWLFRHGETLFNVKNLIQGWCDSPLTPKGIQMTKSVGQKLEKLGVKFDAAFSSDLTRCLETAQILLDCLDSDISVLPDRRLREINTGDCEGDLVSEHLKKYPLSFNIKKYTGVPNGEKWNEAIERIVACLTEIGEHYSHTGGSIMVVSHSMVIAAVKSYLNHAEEFKPVPHNSVTVFEYYKGELKLKLFQEELRYGA
ncbi:MAG: histidine phosphatase family protein [Lachnospiraceae bacterium]|nr:histidine phosphatase family protein [Lachnospiraceae bacterium]